MKRIVCALLFAVMLVCCFTGCSTTFDAKAHIQGNLDVIYFGKVTDEYLAITDATKEELLDVYADGLEIEAKYFAKYFDIDLDLAPEGTLDRIVELYKEIYSYSKYEIGEPVKSGEDYLVSVTIHPIDIMMQVNENWEAVFEANWMAFAATEEYMDLTEEEIEALWADETIKFVESYIPNIGYMEPEIISIEVNKGEDDVYAISDNDFGRIDTLIIQY